MSGAVRWRSRRGPLVVGTCALLLGGCAAALDDAGPAPPSQTAAARTMVPAGFGTLHQEEVTVSLRSGALLIKVTPLDDAVIRLLAPDTHRRLHALALARAAEAAAAATTPAPFLVSFFSYEPDTEFDGEAVHLVQGGRLLRPVAILPVTGGFGAQRLRQQDTQLAVYVFDADIDYGQPLTVRYGHEQSDAWTRIVPRLEVERARVRARSAG